MPGMLYATAIKGINMRYGHIYMIIYAILFVIFSCGGSNTLVYYRRSHDRDIPQDIIKVGEQAIIEKVGQQFYELNFTYSHEQSRTYVSNGDDVEEYWLFWDFQVFGNPYIENTIVLEFDHQGKPLWNGTIHGVPECIKYPESCEFAIDKTRAIELAKKAGLEEGIRPWNLCVKWSREENKLGYYWVISMFDGLVSREAWISMIDGSVELTEYHAYEYYELKH